jgi:hypothetical protein
MVIGHGAVFLVLDLLLVRQLVWAAGQIVISKNVETLILRHEVAMLRQGESSRPLVWMPRMTCSAPTRHVVETPAGMDHRHAGPEMIESKGESPGVTAGPSASVYMATPSLGSGSEAGSTQ